MNDSYLSWNGLGSSKTSRRRPLVSSSTSSSLCSRCQQANKPIDPYQVLAVRRDATVEEIRNAYAKSALLYHPSRHTDEGEEQQRRAYIFRLLAASYETLHVEETRTTYNEIATDALLQQTWSGQVFLGGTKVESPRKKSQNQNRYWGRCTSLQSQSRDLVPTDNIPTLDDASSSSSSSLSDVSTTLEDERHYTYDDTNRLFGGPLSLLYKARQYRSFTDPYDLFDSVMQGASLPRPSQDMLHNIRLHNVHWTLPWDKPRRSAAWTGSTSTGKDNARISTTSRILHHTRLTRTETVAVDKQGRRQTTIQVTSEALPPLEDDDDDGSESSLLQSNKMGCSICGTTSASSQKPSTVYLSSQEEQVSEDGNPSLPDCDFWMHWRDVVCACGDLFPE